MVNALALLITNLIAIAAGCTGALIAYMSIRSMSEKSKKEITHIVLPIVASLGTSFLIVGIIECYPQNKAEAYIGTGIAYLTFTYCLPVLLRGSRSSNADD